MPATLSELEQSNLDFTETVMARAGEVREVVDPTERLLQDLDTVIDALALRVELGATDTRLWRLLAGFYLATERRADYNDLARKHLATFNRPLQIDQPAVAFALPVKVNYDDVPSLDMVRSACASPGGAVMEFGAVRRLSTGGIVALTELLTGLNQVTGMVQMRGLAAFIESIEAAIKAGQGTKEMNDLLASYRGYVAAHTALREEPDAVACN
jgi:hypothetical protein